MILNFTKTLIKLLIIPILIVLSLLIFDISYLVQKGFVGFNQSFLIQFITTLCIPTLLFFVFLRAQYMKIILLIYKESSTLIKKLLADYFKSDNFNKDAFKNTLQVLKPWHDKIDNPFVKKMMIIVLKKIPFHDIFVNISYADISKSNDPNNAALDIFFKRIDEYVENLLSISKLNFIIFFLIILNILITFFL